MSPPRSKRCSPRAPALPLRSRSRNTAPLVPSVSPGALPALAARTEQAPAARRPDQEWLRSPPQEREPAAGRTLGAVRGVNTPSTLLPLAPRAPPPYPPLPRSPAAPTKCDCT